MKNIEFIAKDKEVFDIINESHPYPATKNMPEWFLRTPKHLKNEPLVGNDGNPSTTIKNCMPFIDFLTAGYYIPLPVDVWIENQSPNNKRITWSQNKVMVCEVQDPRGSGLLPQKEGFDGVNFKFINQWIVKTPSGYSSLFQPPYMHDLPFEIISALVDTDKHPIPVNFPFRFKKGFSGLLPKGTPIAQVIPIKRENWQSSYSFDDGSMSLKWNKALTTFFNRYRTYFRSEKSYKCPFHK